VAGVRARMRGEAMGWNGKITPFPTLEFAFYARFGHIPYSPYQFYMVN
jgi:hypothetical protein